MGRPIDRNILEKFCSVGARRIAFYTGLVKQDKIPMYTLAYNNNNNNKMCNIQQYKELNIVPPESYIWEHTKDN